VCVRERVCACVCGIRGGGGGGLQGGGMGSTEHAHTLTPVHTGTGFLDCTRYRVAKTHRMPDLYNRSFPAKELHN